MSDPVQVHPDVEVAFVSPYDDDDTVHEAHLALLRAPSIEDDDHAEAIAESLKDNRTQLAQVKIRAQRWLDRQTVRLERCIEFDLTRLRDYFERLNKRSHSLIHATLKYTAVKEKLVIVDESEALAWARSQECQYINALMHVAEDAVAFAAGASGNTPSETSEWESKRDLLEKMKTESPVWRFINKPKPSISKINAHFKETGEIADGCLTAAAHDSFSAKTEDELL